MTIVRSLCKWLVRRHDLDSNPFDHEPARPDAAPTPQLRALSQGQWELVQTWLDEEFTAPPSPFVHWLKPHPRLRLHDGHVSGKVVGGQTRLAAARAAQRRRVSLVESRRRGAVGTPGYSWAAYRNIRERRRGASDAGAYPQGAGDGLRSMHGEYLGTGLARGRADQAGLNTLAATRLRVVLGGARCATGRAAGQSRAQSLATTSIYVRVEKGRRQRAMQAAHAPSSGEA